MRKYILGFLVVVGTVSLAGCSGVVGAKNATPTSLTLNVTTDSGAVLKGPATIMPQAGSGTYTLNAVNASGVVQDVNWSLGQGNTACSPQCGTLSAGSSPTYSATYKPPAVLPKNSSAVITARLGTDPGTYYDLAVQIVPAVTVQITNKFTSTNAGGTAVILNATVANDGANAGVTWTLTAGGANCAPSCGTLASPSAPTTTATYTPPANVPTGASASPTITATSVTNFMGSDTFTFTISPSVVVTITNKFSSQNLGGASVNVTAQVTNDASSAGVTWRLTVGGADCAPACGTLTVPTGSLTTVMYTPPTVAPSGANDMPTISAISAAQPSQRDSFAFTISLTSLLHGNYSLLLRGYDGNLQPMAFAGSIKADGSGNIVGGEFDMDDGGGILTDTTSLAGQYTISALPNGGIGGTITITNFTFPGSSIGVAFAYVLSADGSRGKVIELDGSGFRNSGTMVLQDSTALSGGNLAGTFGFGLDSDAPVGGRTVEAGEFTVGPNGVTGGLADESVAGNPTPRYSASAIAASTAGQFTEPDTSGRGTLKLNVNGDLISYAYYVVNAGQFNLVQIDTGAQYGTVQSGSAFLQKSIAAADTTSVLQMTGMDVVPSPAPPYRIGPDVIIGVLSIKGTNFDLTFDYNDLGNVAQGDSVAGTVLFDATTGRGTLTVPGGYNNHFFNSAVFYQYDSGKAFIVDTDPSTCVATACNPPLPPSQTVTNIAASGTFTPQTQASGGYSNASLSGNMLFVSGGSAVASIRDFEAAFQAAPGSDPSVPGSLGGFGDLTSMDPAVGSAVNIAFSGSYNIDNPNLGHGVAMLPAGVFADGTPAMNFPGSFYMIAPNQFVMIAVPPLQSVQTTGESGVSFFDPQ